MSRIGRMPIAVPAGVTVTIAENNLVTVKGDVYKRQGGDFFYGKSSNENHIKSL